MTITLNALLLSGASNYAAAQALGPMNFAADKFHINTNKRAALFIANAAVESRCFQSFKEDLFYRHADRLAEVFPGTFEDAASAEGYVGKPEKLANRIYANKYGNGNEASGDGWKYRGRGFMGLTFKSNYERAGELTGRPYVESPDMLLQPEDAALSAGAFWSWNGLNELADADDVASVTRRINSGMLAAQRRAELYKLILAAF